MYLMTGPCLWKMWEQHGKGGPPQHESPTKMWKFWSVECYDGVEVVGLVMEWLEVVKSVGYVKVLIRYLVVEL